MRFALSVLRAVFFAPFASLRYFWAHRYAPEHVYARHQCVSCGRWDQRDTPGTCCEPGEEFPTLGRQW